jgi:putative transcriptional regulator
VGVLNKLKEIRMKEYMMNQKEFCENVLKINTRTYSPIEGNKVQGNIETAMIISKALNRKIEDIWYFVNEAE